MRNNDLGRGQALVGLSSLAGAPESQPRWAIALPAVSSIVMAMMLSAGFGLYLVSNSLVGTLQGLLIRRLEALALARTALVG
jgi:membrane protein insertase Oxa1/YidC/SpoIIIJ